MNKDSKIFVAGHSGMVGSAILRKLKKEGYENIITRTHEELDLSNQNATLEFFMKNRPEYVFVAAAKVGGIYANNTYRAEFIYNNLIIECNVIHSAYLSGVKKILYLGSSCIYPRECPQPIKEEYLLTSELEKTNEPYAVAKIAGIKLCESYYKQYGCDYISVMPTNLFGNNDNYNLETSHVLPAMIRKIHLAKLYHNNDCENLMKDLKMKKEDVVEFLNKHGIFEDGKDTYLKLWGSGSPYREFMHVDDAADACLFVMNDVNSKDIYDSGISQINIGTGKDQTLEEIAYIIKDIVGYEGKIVWDTTKPDGTPKKQLDVSLINSLGWRYKIPLEDGIEMTYKNYLETYAKK